MGLCSCKNPKTTIPSGPCSVANCLRIPYVYVPLEETVFPCGQDLSIDLSNKISFDSAQDNSISEFIIRDSTDNLINATWSLNSDRSSIQLTVRSNYTGVGEPSPVSTDHLFGKITYEVRQGHLNDVATITIPFKSHCNSLNIPNNQYCDPCTGNLLDKITNISVTPDDSDDSGSTVNIKIG